MLIMGCQKDKWQVLAMVNTCVFKEQVMVQFWPKTNQNIPYQLLFYNLKTQKGQAYVSLPSQEVSAEKVVSKLLRKKLY